MRIRIRKPSESYAITDYTKPRPRLSLSFSVFERWLIFFENPVYFNLGCYLLTNETYFCVFRWTPSWSTWAFTSWMWRSNWIPRPKRQAIFLLPMFDSTLFLVTLAYPNVVFLMNLDTVQTKVFFDNQNYKNLKTQILKMLYFFLNLSERRKL